MNLWLLVKLLPLLYSDLLQKKYVKRVRYRNSRKLFCHHCINITKNLITKINIEYDLLKSKSRII